MFFVSPISSSIKYIHIITYPCCMPFYEGFGNLKPCVKFLPTNSWSFPCISTCRWLREDCVSLPLLWISTHLLLNHCVGEWVFFVRKWTRCLCHMNEWNIFSICQFWSGIFKNQTQKATCFTLFQPQMSAVSQLQINHLWYQFRFNVCPY